MKKKRRLYLVGQDPADIFDDLDKLKSDLANPKQAARVGRGNVRPHSSRQGAGAFQTQPFRFSMGRIY